MHFYSLGLARLFELLPYALYVGNHYGNVSTVIAVVVVLCVGRVACVTGFLVVVVFTFKFLL